MHRAMRLASAWLAILGGCGGSPEPGADGTRTTDAPGTPTVEGTAPEPRNGVPPAPATLPLLLAHYGCGKDASRPPWTCPATEPAHCPHCTTAQPCVPVLLGIDPAGR